VDCENLLFQGNGVIDGQGFLWWMREYVGNNHYGRPDLIDMSRGKKIEWTGIKVQNSPQFHFYWQDMDGVYFHDFEIYVDIWG
jgi:polygalacturonase